MDEVTQVEGSDGVAAVGVRGGRFRKLKGGGVIQLAARGIDQGSGIPDPPQLPVHRPMIGGDARAAGNRAHPKLELVRRIQDQHGQRSVGINPSPRVLKAGSGIVATDGFFDPVQVEGAFSDDFTCSLDRDVALGGLNVAGAVELDGDPDHVGDGGIAR